MDSFDIARIRDVWKRLFDKDVEKKRAAAGLPSVGRHLQQLEDRQPHPPLVDQLLAEIEAQEPVETRTKKRKPLRKKQESKDPGITPGDVFRVFSAEILRDRVFTAECRTILPDEEIEAVLGKDLPAEVAERSTFRCKDSGDHRHAPIVKRIWSSGKCHPNSNSLSERPRLVLLVR